MSWHMVRLVLRFIPCLFPEPSEGGRETGVRRQSGRGRWMEQLEATLFPDLTSLSKAAATPNSHMKELTSGGSVAYGGRWRHGHGQNESPTSLCFGHLLLNLVAAAN